MTDLLRQEIAATATTIVVKVGTHVLTHADGRLNAERLAQLAEELHEVIDSGRRVVLVSSGAVGAGMGRLGLGRRPTDLAQLQAVAAVGQSVLVEAYERSFGAHGRHVGQVLLSAGDVADRTRYLNARNTILTLLKFDAVPIINENDTVAVEELQAKFGDNDQLAAIVTNLIQAPLLVLLSDVDGLYDGDPALPESRVVSLVEKFDESTLALAADCQTALGTGGMTTKLQAARQATAGGENVIIANGSQPGALREIIQGKPVGTLFLAQGQTVAARKRWIGFAVRPRGRILVDSGAQRAIEHDGGSLLAIGVREVSGQFAKGDVVAICDLQGVEFARGLTNYRSEDMDRIRRRKTEEIAEALGHCPYDEAVHRDNLVVTT